MRILFIAPQPFYEERGTLIAIDLLLRALSDRGDKVDLLTFHLGEDRNLPGLEIIRIRPWFAPARVRPGLSIAKLWCDIFLSFRALSLVRSRQYDLIYAVEEGAFVAMTLGKLFRLPFVFDMDSSMADQIIERFPAATPVGGMLRWMESLPMRGAIAVIPMCEAIAERARMHCRGFVRTLKDVSLIKAEAIPDPPEELREKLSLAGPVAMYIGNLEPYQGIDLLLDAFSIVLKSSPSAALLIIGGSDQDLQKYSVKINQTGLKNSAYLVGRRSVSHLGYFMSQADVLVSPRTKGINTPMKVYSYLDSGVPVVATNLPTHTQVMTSEVAKLSAPDAASFAAAISELFEDPAQRQRLAANARELVRREHSEEAFRRQVDGIFGELERRLGTS
ncbi:MAG: glycosyltransferase [Gammaproteobacteria bacterium]|nr:glycosyltransferase [Gammaproteobacteria bacterium]NNL51709.1 glycosyltransferase [Woeseiaceae bacterium]